MQIIEANMVDKMKSFSVDFFIDKLLNLLEDLDPSSLSATASDEFTASVLIDTYDFLQQNRRHIQLRARILFLSSKDTSFDHNVLVRIRHIIRFGVHPEIEIKPGVPIRVGIQHGPLIVEMVRRHSFVVDNPTLLCKLASIEAGSLLSSAPTQAI